MKTLIAGWICITIATMPTEAQWVQIGTDISLRLTVGCFLSRNLSYVVGMVQEGAHHSIAIYQLRDAGNEWILRGLIPLDDNSVRNVFFVSPAEGWIIGTGGMVFHTLDSGATWERIAFPTSEVTLTELWIDTTDQVGWILALEGELALFRTTDRGNTWQQMPFPENTPFTSITAAGNGLFFATSPGALWSYHNGVWSRYSDIPEIATSLYIASPNAAWCATRSGSIYTSADYLLHWSKQFQLLDAERKPIPLWGIAGSGNRHLWAIGQTNMILHSTDGGTTWNIEQTPLSPQHFFYTIAPVDSTLCFAIASDGKVYRAQYTILSTHDDLQPTQFSIVPQPVQDICLLSGAPTDEDQLRIYTLDGRLVQTIHLLPQHRTLDLSHLPSGAYFIHLGKVRRLLLKQ